VLVHWRVGIVEKPDAFQTRLSAQAVFTLATPDLQAAYSTHTKHVGKTLLGFDTREAGVRTKKFMVTWLLR
jgi:hypothetical protein